MRPIVIKVGGSLFDLPDLGTRLKHYLRQYQSHTIWLVPGGGECVNTLRRLDLIHQLGELVCHDLALQLMSVNGRILHELLPDSQIIAAYDTSLPGISIVSAVEFCRHDEMLEKSWRVTSDSIALRIGQVVDAQRLILLKSFGANDFIDWPDAAQRGWVDAAFPELIRQGKPLPIDIVHFRP